jgi:hypothetical protein
MRLLSWLILPLSALVVSGCVLVFGWQSADALGGVGTAAPAGRKSPAPGQPPAGPTGITALLKRATIVATRPQVPGYERDCGPGEGCVFGTPWSDDTDAPDGHNGCDTRNDVLRRTLDEVTFKPGSNQCDVVRGHFVDPYTGRTMDYESEGSQIQIDHLFPLAAAWDLGAFRWSLGRRTEFANDTRLELLAVEGGANQSKGDSTPASWLPPNQAYRCDYLTRYLEVALHYDLQLTRADASVISAAARKC